MMHVSTISVSERGLEYPRKQPEEPSAKTFFLGFLMLSSTPGLADVVFDLDTLAWSRVERLECSTLICSLSEW